MSMNESDRGKRRTPAANFIWFGETSWQWDFSFKALLYVCMQFSLRRFNEQMHCESNGKCTAAAAQLKWMKWLETQIKHSLAPSHTSDVFKISFRIDTKRGYIKLCYISICNMFQLYWNADMRLMVRFWLVWARASIEWGSCQNVVGWNGILSNLILSGVFKTLPEAQRTQGIDSLTWVISPAK